MKITSTVLCAAVISVAAAHPTKTKRATSYCEQYSSTTTGSYTVYNDLWNQDSATSGSQCFTVDGLSGDTLSWGTTWSWTGGDNQVKSYANAVADVSGKQLSAISSLPSTWSWSYDGTDLVADVAYDLFTSSTAGGTEEFEIMVWLAAIGGAGPISATYGSDGSATAIATPTVGSTSFSLYKGSNGAQTVYSFVAPSEVTDFDGDLLDFFTYLIDSQGFSSSQYLVSAGAGTEAFTGSDAVFTVSGYSLTSS